MNYKHNIHLTQFEASTIKHTTHENPQIAIWNKQRRVTKHNKDKNNTYELETDNIHIQENVKKER